MSPTRPPRSKVGLRARLSCGFLCLARDTPLTARTRTAALDSSPPGELTPELFAGAIDRGWYTYAERLVQIGHAGDSGVSPDLYKALSEALDNAERRLKSSIDRTLDQHQKGRSAAAADSPDDAVGDGVSVVAPAFQWAQNTSRVLIEVKFAHKMSAPAATNAEVQDVELNARSLRMVAAERSKRFELELALAGEINPDASSWAESSVGRAILTLEKAEGKRFRWKGLLAAGAARPPNMQVWWDMQEALGGLGDADDDDDDEGESSSASKSKAKSKPKSKDASKTKTKPKDGADAKKPETADSIDKKTKKKVKELERRADRRKDKLDDEANEAKRQLDVDARKEIYEINEALESKLMLARHPPGWLPTWIPVDRVVCDPLWPYFVQFARAKREYASGDGAALKKVLGVLQKLKMGAAAAAFGFVFSAGFVAAVSSKRTGAVLCCLFGIAAAACGSLAYMGDRALKSRL